MRLVVDASAIGALLLEETVPGLRVMAARMLSESSIVAPPHWPVELVSIVIKAMRTDRLTMATGRSAWARAAEIIGVAEVENETRATAIFDLARETGLKAADAAYLELAYRTDAPLLTGDGRLARECNRLGVTLPFDPNQ